MALNAEEAKQLAKTVTLGSASESKEIQEYLQKINLVRVVVNGGRGLGHQAASATAIDRLRELGYQGDIQVVYESRYIADNLAVLMPEFTSPEKAAQNRIRFKRLKRDEGDCFNLPFAPLVLTGALDESTELKGTASAVYNGGIYINLEPTDWKEPRWLESIEDEESQTLDDKAALFSFQSRDLEERDEIDERLLAAPGVASAARFFEQLLEDNDEDNVLFQSVYGLYPASILDPFSGKMVRKGNALEPVEELKALLAGLNLFQQDPEVSKPVVLLIHSKVEDQEYSELLAHAAAEARAGRRSGRVILAKDSDDARKRLESKELGPNDVLLVRTGNLAKDTFEGLLQASSLPPIAEGCNTIAFLEAQRSFLHGGAPNKTIEIIPDDYFISHGVDPKLQELHLKACMPLEKGLAGGKASGVDEQEAAQNLAKFLLACQKKEMNAYFEIRQAWFKERPDVLGTALLSASQKPLYTDEESSANAYLVRVARLLQATEMDLSKIQVNLERVSKIMEKRVADRDPAVLHEFYRLCVQAISKCAVDQSDPDHARMAIRVINEYLPMDKKLNSGQIRRLLIGDAQLMADIVTQHFHQGPHARLWAEKPRVPHPKIADETPSLSDVSRQLKS